MANTNKDWVGAVEPAAAAPSGNEHKSWVGAVEPVGAVGPTVPVLSNPTTPVYTP